MQIRHTRPEDLPAMQEIFADARAFMRENGNPDQWGDRFPTREMLDKDLALHRSYVCEDNGKIAATFAFTTDGEPTYRVIRGGAWLDDAPYGVVHRIAAAKGTAQTTPETPAEIRPLRIEAGFTKTVHILFPSPVTYIDIGSMDIIAGKADGAENVVRVKAAVRNFAAETNLTVITEDGGFFTFDVYYAENPAVSTLNLTVQEPQPESMKKPAAVGYPQPTAPASESRVLLREVGREKPATVKRMLSDIYRQNRTDVKGIRTKKYGIGVEVLGIYVFNDVIYIHTCISNDTNISFEVDARRFIVADRKLAKRTAQQQTSLEILRVCNDPAVVRGHQRQRTVFALPKLTISDDKVLLLEIIEKNGARHQTVEIPAKELLEAKLL